MNGTPQIAKGAMPKDFFNESWDSVEEMNIEVRVRSDGSGFSADALFSIITGSYN